MYGLKIYCMMQVMILFRILDFKFQKIQKWLEIHEIEHGLVIWHKYAIVNFFVHFETSCLWEVAQMKSQGILEQRPVTLRRTLSLLKPWAFTCRHESPLLISRCPPSKRVSRREACEQTIAPAVREACEQTAVQAHREASPLTRLCRPPSSQLLPLF